MGPAEERLLEVAFRAMTEQNVAALRECIGRGYRVRRDDDLTDLHVAAQDGNAGIVALLLEALETGVLDSFDACGFTSLMRAAVEGHLDVVRVLLAAGCDVNARDAARIGNTALRVVIGSCSPDMARLLLEAGADTTIAGWMNASAFDVATKRLERNPDSESEAIHDALRGARPNRVPET